MMLARNHAITEHEITHVCQRDAQTTPTCSPQRDYGEKWNSGWLVFVDHNNNNEYDQSDRLVQVTEANDSSGHHF